MAAVSSRDWRYIIAPDFQRTTDSNSNLLYDGIIWGSSPQPSVRVHTPPWPHHSTQEKEGGLFKGEQLIKPEYHCSNSLDCRALLVFWFFVFLLLDVWSQLHNDVYTVAWRLSCKSTTNDVWYGIALWLITVNPSSTTTKWFCTHYESLIGGPMHVVCKCQSMCIRTGL